MIYYKISNNTDNLLSSGFLKNTVILEIITKYLKNNEV